jgi:hypothetical protein
VLRFDGFNRVVGGGSSEPKRAGRGGVTPSGTLAANAAWVAMRSPKEPSPSSGFMTTPNTVSPSAKPSTPGPMASTVPAKSLPSTTGKRCSIIPLSRPLATLRSKPLIELDATRTRIPPSPGSGVEISTRVAGAPKSVVAIAFMRVPFRR